MTHIFHVYLRLDQIDARPFAALDLVLQTVSVTVLKVTVFALTHQKGLLQQAKTFPDGTRARIRAEIPAFGFLCATMDAQARKLAVGQEHIRIRLIVAQQNVVRRSPFLDQRLFEQQRFGFVTGDGGLNLRDARHQSASLGRVPGLAKITGKALLQVLGFAHIQKLGFGIEHAIDAGTTTAGREKGTWIKGLGHVQALASTMP